MLLTVDDRPASRKNRFFAALVCLCMALALLPATALAAGPELALLDNATGNAAVLGTDYTYDMNTGLLSIIKNGDYTLSMVTPSTSTSHRVKVERSTQVNLTLDNVRITCDSCPLWLANNDSNGGVTILTLKGDNRLTNTAFPGSSVYGLYLNTGGIRIEGDGSLQINAPNGTGILLYQARDLLMAGGNIIVNANIGIDVDTGSSHDTQDTNRYVQTGGSMRITARSSGIQTNVLLLSGGSLAITGNSDNTFSQGVNVPWGATVSGGSLRIDGRFWAGVLSSKAGAVGTGKISFTGGVTDIALPDGSIAVMSQYSSGTYPMPMPTGVPALPITVGSNMRVPWGGNLVWSNWARSADDEPWNVLSTFSTGSVTYQGTGVIGASSRVRIEPNVDDAGAGAGAGAPKTGDGTPLGLLCGLMLLGGAGLMAKRRRRA